MPKEYKCCKKCCHLKITYKYAMHGICEIDHKERYIKTLACKDFDKKEGVR
ncbi:MAG: hypothetical protein Q4E88_02855 [Coriobacteriia bacterium]|nr:hypothetical protein [Coriobacteriia bacterium]